MIDLKNMKSLTVDGSGVAKVQTGNRLGDVAQTLWDNGNWALPHGTCPYVCIFSEPSVIILTLVLCSL